MSRRERKKESEMVAACRRTVYSMVSAASIFGGAVSQPAVDEGEPDERE